MASLGSLVIELAANTARLQSDMGKAVGIVETGARKMKSVFAAFGVVGGGGFLGAVIGNAAKQAIELGDSINKAAIKAGIGGKAMSELAYAAKLADVDIASLSNAIKKMQVSLSEAGSGAKEPKEALAALGLTIADLQKRKPEAQFELLADRIGKLTDPADRARAAVELFGKAGTDLLPLFAEGAAGIAKAREEAEKLGISLSGEQIKALSDVDDSIKRMDASWAAFAAKATSVFAPAITGLTDALAGVDTRSVDKQISDLEETLSRPIRNRSGDQRAALQQQLDQLRGRRDLAQLQSLQTGTSGGPTGRIRTLLDPAGFGKEAPAGDKETDKLVANFNKTADELETQFNGLMQSQLEDANDAWAEQMISWQEFEDARIEAEEATNKGIAKMREEQATQLSATAQLWKDTFLNAFDDMVNTGKIKWNELLKYMVAEIGRNAISSAFDKAFGGKGGSGGGLWDGLKSLVGGLFSAGSSGSSTASWIDDFKANGGPVIAGKTYMVGERGAELFRPAVSGNIIPNGRGGGSMPVIHQTNHFTGGGDPQAIRRMMDESNRRLLDSLSRNHALVGT